MPDDEQTRRRAAVLAMLPETVRAAVLGRDLGALKSALAELDPREAGLVIEQLRQVGILAGTPQREEATALLEEFAPLLRDIVAVARGDQQRRGVVEQVLAGLQEAWRLRPAQRQRGRANAARATVSGWRVASWFLPGGHVRPLETA